MALETARADRKKSFRFSNLKTKTKVLAGVAAPLALLGVVGAVALINVDRIDHTTSWVDHTHKVLEKATSIVATAVDMETGMRGYLLAGREEFLAPYKSGEAATYAAIAELQQTVSDNPGQVARLGDVEQVLRDWQADVTEMQIELRRDIGDAETMNDMAALVGEARGKTYFDKFRGQIATFIEREETLLRERRATFEQKLDSGTAAIDETRTALKWVTHTYEVIDQANAILAAAVDMETGMRGYLLAGKTEFLEPYEAGSDRFGSIVDALKTTVSDNPAQVTLLEEISETIEAWKTDVVTPMIDLRTTIGDAKSMDDMADLVGEARGKAYFDTFRQLMADFKAEEETLMIERQADKEATVSFTFLTIASCMVIATIIGLGLAWTIGGSIGGPIGALTTAMRRLADGDTTVDISGRERGDEIGAMARATEVFKESIQMQAASREKEEADRNAAEAHAAMMNELQASLATVVKAAVAGDFSERISAQFADAELNDLASGVNRLLDTVNEGVGETGRVLARVAEGDLKDRMSGDFQGAFADLQRNVNDTVENLSKLVGQIAATTNDVSGGATKITSGAEDLASRAEQQASSLEQTAATMEEMSASIKANADSSASANTLASDASERADAGGAIVKNAVSAMNEIEAGATKIADIISVIDGIAFQTNLLALNAAVEAARAGDAGKGFAVVASEVRALAQRSSEASRDIRQLIETSAGQVSEGVKLVTETGASLEGIVASIGQVEEAIKSIAAACVEQASSVEQISSTISHMDEMTQKNSALAEQSASNARSLAGGASKLQELIRYFDANDVAGGAPREASDDAAWRSVESTQQKDASRAPAPVEASRSGATAGGWAEF